MVVDIQEIGKIPVQPGRNVYIRDVATVADGTDVNFGYALVDGQRSVYIPVVKKNTASTLTVVADIHRAMPTLQERAARGRGHPLRVRRIADGGGGHPQRGHRGGHRRRADRA